VTAGGFDFHDEPSSNCGPQCTTRPRATAGQYSTNLFSARARQIVEQHDTSRGLFLYLAYQGVHEPREAPDRYVAPYKTRIRDDGRRVFAGMIAALDEGLGNVTSALSAKGMLDATLILVTTDNGGPTTECSTTGQSNWPLRGSKCSVWEGGTRGTAFISWAGLPTAVRGRPHDGLAHAADLMPTLVSAVGSRLWVNETLPLDGIDLWGALLANATSPRTSVYYGISQDQKGPAVRDDLGWKLVTRGGGGGRGAWSKEQLPNSSSSCVVDEAYNQLSLLGAAHGPHESTAAAFAEDDLLFYLPDDRGEHHPLDLATHTDVVVKLRALVVEYERTKVPQVTNDPACPDFAPIDGPDGKWIGPWCDGVTVSDHDYHD